MSNDVMTQEEIENLLKNAGQIVDETDAIADANDVDRPEIADFLTTDEIDVLGEIGNICMGTSATALYDLLLHKVLITTPSISMQTQKTLMREYPAPIVGVAVHYTEGVTGDNVLLLKEYDVALITDLLLGGSGEVDPLSIELDEIHLSAIREVMNQLVGASATAMASLLGTSVNISTPISKRVIIADDSLGDMIKGETFVKISFKMEIEDVLVSQIMQIWPVDFARKIAGMLLGTYVPEEDEFAATSHEAVTSEGSDQFLFSNAAQAGNFSMGEQSEQVAPSVIVEDNTLVHQVAQQSPPPVQAAPPVQAQQPAPQPAPPQAVPPQQPAAYQPPVEQAPPVQQQPAQQQPPPYAPPMPDGQYPQGAQQPPYGQYPYAPPYAPQGGYPNQYAQGYPYPNMGYGYAPPPNAPYPPQPHEPQPAPQRQATPPKHSNLVIDGTSSKVNEVIYPSFDEYGREMPMEVPSENLGLLMRVPVQVTVVLGTKRMKIKDVLNFNAGTVVVLDKIAGEPVELLVNGTPVAKGEVVVVEDNYGVRITEINTATLRESI